MDKKVYKSIFILIIIISFSLELNGENKKKSGRPLFIDVVEIELPVYKFKDNETGKFLEMFCDSCANFCSFFQIPLVGKANPEFVKEFVNKDIENFKDYMVISTPTAELELFDITWGIVKLNNGRKCVLTDIRKETLEKLQLIATTEIDNLIMQELNWSVQIDLITIFYIPSDTKCEIATLLANLHPIQEIDSDVEPLRWFKTLVEKR